MSKSRRRAISLLIVAAILAGIAGCMALSVIGSANEEVRSIRRQYGEQINVVVVSRDIPVRGTLTVLGFLDGSLRVERRPRAFTPEGAYLVPDPGDERSAALYLADTLQGYTMIPLSPGDILLSSMIEKSVVVPPSMRAVSLAVNNVTSVSGYVSAGDRVDVIASFELQEGETKKFQRTLVLLQDVEVLSVSWLNNLGASSAITPTTGLSATVLYGRGRELLGAFQQSEERDTVVTLALSLDDATKLTFMENFGKEVRLVLRRLDDKSQRPIPTVAPEQYK